MIVPALPATLAPPAPFPLVIAQSHETEFVAPGVRRGVYRLQTTDGPLVVTVVAVDVREPTVRIASVVANDTLISTGETVSSMARRTAAVAGVNADYFDIGQTNQPLNAVVRDGALLRTPSKRVVLDVRTDRSVHFENVAFSGSARYGPAVVPVRGVNEWPPQGGASVLTPAYGVVRAYPGVTTATLVPLDVNHGPGTLSGSYLVTAVDASLSGPVTGTLLGFGPAARGVAPPPNVGDTVRIDASTTPPLDEMTNAVGGGPLLVAGGAIADDPNAPAPEERDRRFPVSGAGTLPNGELVLVAVDGRQPSLSIGVTRPQFAALVLGFGATDAMAFDSGGSATLVARVLGDADARVLNVPSDGEERAVADGLFIYSDAPHGPPARLVVRPAAIVALPQTSVPIALALTDAAGHAVAPSREPAPRVLAGAATTYVAVVRAAGLVARVPFDVVPRLARLDIAPGERNPDPRATVRFTATGLDERGRVVTLGDAVRFTSDGGRFVRTGTLRVADRDVHVVATAAGARAEWLLRVGHHREPLPIFDAVRAAAWRFDAAPAGSRGGVAFAADRPELSLRYDFSAGERAAYADTGFALPGEPQSFTVEVNGDRSGVGIRAAFVNAFGERRALTLARAVDWTGWRPVTITLPDDLNPPVQLVSLYAVDSLANAATRAVGTLSFRNPSVVVAGNP